MVFWSCFGYTSWWSIASPPPQIHNFWLLLNTTDFCVKLKYLFLSVYILRSLPTDLGLGGEAGLGDAADETLSALPVQLHLVMMMTMMMMITMMMMMMQLMNPSPLSLSSFTSISP